MLETVAMEPETNFLGMLRSVIFVGWISTTSA